MWVMITGLRCMDGSPWIQKSNTICLKSANCHSMKNFFPSFEVSLMVDGRSVHDAAQEGELRHLAEDHDSNFEGKFSKASFLKRVRLA